MHRECRERFPRHRLQRKPLISDPGMDHGTCVTHVPWCMSGSLTAAGKTFPVFPAHAQPAILRIWQEPHSPFSCISILLHEAETLWNFWSRAWAAPSCTPLLSIPCYSMLLLHDALIHGVIPSIVLRLTTTFQFDAPSISGWVRTDCSKMKNCSSW